MDLTYLHNDEDLKFYRKAYLSTLMMGVGVFLSTSANAGTTLGNDTSGETFESTSDIIQEANTTDLGQEDNSSSLDELGGYQIEKMHLINKLESFKNLKPGWNGYSASSIDSDVVDESKRILWQLQGLPDVFPTARNSVQIEYENYDNGNYLELEVGQREIVGFYMDTGNDTEEEFQLDNIHQVNKLINRLNVAG